MKHFRLFLALLAISLSFSSCKQEQKEELLCSCFVFSDSNSSCSYYLSINKQGMLEITHGTSNLKGLDCILKGDGIEPTKYNLIGTMGIVDSIYDFKCHKWNFYSYNGFICAKKTLSHEQLDELNNILLNIKSTSSKKTKNKHNSRKKKCNDYNNISEIVLMFNGEIHTYWEEEADSYEKAFINKLRNLSPMPILMKPKPDCISGEGSQTKSIIEKVEGIEQ